ncbi:MAG TPA: chloride channel protein [Ktedonobacteraceae bacterium]|nr:chloride channel protein [Ktedonobacteraceae bacterium]
MFLAFSRTWRKVVNGLNGLGNHEALGILGDFTTTPRVVLLSLFAIVIGTIGAFVALALLRLIGLFTNLFFFQRWSTDLVSPAGNHLGIFEILVPVVGALIIGLMARYGSERIRGHGIPEAIEAILINGSKVEPKVALLKPLSSAISIGSGGPFGAEGPIIMTGGAFGSMIAQFFHLTSTERKTLLVAGAAAGMSATFAAPIASVLLAVELLLFEWKPRSLIPVALASVTADVIRRYIIGLGPLFPTSAHPTFIGPENILACALIGLLAGALSALLTVAVYASEDSFRLLPIHWMWWPAIGGLVIGIGGLIYPQALGVGYDTIGALLQGHYTLQLLLGVLIVKSIIWSVSLGSGTSGGVLAPLLMMGGALGGLASYFLPNLGPGFWPLVSMGAVLGGTMRSPFTGIIFMLELTHDVNMLVPLLIAVIVAHGFTVLVMRRSILTEKVSRRGYHLSREYATDPLEIIFVREAMRTNIAALSDTLDPQDLAGLLHGERDGQANGQLQRLYPILDADGRLQGVVTRNDLLHMQRAQLSPIAGHSQSQGATLIAEHTMNDGHSVETSLVQDKGIAPHLLHTHPVVAYPDEPLRTVVYRMAETGYTRFPVVERSDPGKLLGMISLNDLLKARVRNLEEERHRERVLRLRLLAPLRHREKVEKR